jgi:uncharacterized protein YjbJ (UPF0337 family)
LRFGRHSRTLAQPTGYGRGERLSSGDDGNDRLQTGGRSTVDDDQIKGKLKEGEGKLTGDDDRVEEGRSQEAWGDTKNKAGDVKDAAEDKLDDAKDKIT